MIRRGGDDKRPGPSRGRSLATSTSTSTFVVVSLFTLTFSPPPSSMRPFRLSSSMPTTSLPASGASSSPHFLPAPQTPRYRPLVASTPPAADDRLSNDGGLVCAANIASGSKRIEPIILLLPPASSFGQHRWQLTGSRPVPARLAAPSSSTPPPQQQRQPVLLPLCSAQPPSKRLLTRHGPLPARADPQLFRYSPY